MLKNIDKFWVYLILFMNGWYFTLPVTDTAMPLLLTPVQVVHGVFLHEFLLLVYILFLIGVNNGRLTIGQSGVRSFALLIAGLGCLGVLSTGINLQPIKELAGACRYFLFALYFLLATVWGEKYGPHNVLQALLLGIASAGAINLFYTFKLAFVQLGGFPLLLGQNGPGGYLGLGVVLSAWLMLERRSTMNALVAIATCAIGVFAATISYSKLSMLMAAFGLIAWFGIFLSTLVSRRSRRISAVVLVVMVFTLFSKRELVGQYFDVVDVFITYKFKNLDQRSVGERSQYWYITNEIVARNPLFGVGYGGFYEATLKTETYRQQASAEEDPEAGAKGQSNPHNSLLYYAAANGLPGVLLALFLFIVCLRALWRGLTPNGVLGMLVWGALTAAYLIFAMTLPTLFNTSILYIPCAAAVVFSHRVRVANPWRQRSLRLPETRSHSITSGAIS